VPNVFREWIPSTPPLLPDIQIQDAGERDSMGRYWNEFPVSALTNSFVLPSLTAMASPGPPPGLGEFKVMPSGTREAVIPSSVSYKRLRRLYM